MPYQKLTSSSRCGDSSCDWCASQLGTRIFHFEGKRYCSWGCMEHGAPQELSRPLFEAKPFPPGLGRLRAHVPQL